MRVVLMSKRFERLQAARARAMERASRPTRAAASSVSARSGAATASTASEDDGCGRAPSRGSSSRRPDLHRGRDAPARWWEVPDASETDRRGDAPEAATREGGETARDRRCDSGKKKRVNGSRVRRPPMRKESATTTTTTRAPAPPRARGRSIFPPQTRERAKEPQKSRARSRVPPRSPPRPRARVSRRGPRRRRPPRRAPTKTHAKTAVSQKKQILRLSASGASPPAWRSRSAPRAAGETTASPSRNVTPRGVPRRGATGRGGAGTRERPRAFWGKARDASLWRRRLRQPPPLKKTTRVMSI